ncbi:MAG: GAF domain-containing protein [Deltaproteobacteria bacterium]|nr:GAF domain-containing protein [Deltaproteobacteria bacterium]MBW2171438.1 GAF domain-containing protein [Deltaproteobacteria bacterium]MBW2258855.1 GAF domain-containing protein [Deltaproteobacteria bacterium]
MKCDYFAALYDVARVINASLDPCRVLEEIVRSLAKALDVKACSIKLLDTRRKTLRLGALHGLSDGCVCKGPILVKESQADRRALKGKIIHLKDARSDEDLQSGAEVEGVQSVLAVPLMVGNRAMGVLKLYTTRIREFGEQEIKFIEAVASLSAIALENARLHEALQTDYDLAIAHKYRLDDN